MTRWYLAIRWVIITIMIILMVIGLVSIIISVIASMIINSNSQAVGYTWFNDLQCSPDITCPIQSDDKLWIIAEDVKISSGRSGYQKSVAQRCADLVGRVVTAEKTSHITTPPTLTLHGTFNNHPQDPTFGGLWSDNKGNVWLAFRGTLSNTIREWKNDFTYNQESLPSSKLKAEASQKIFMLRGTSDTASVHSGFMDVYNMFRSDLITALKTLEPKKIIVTGHSLGGGVSTLCSIDLASIYPGIVVSYTFAAPRVGNAQLCTLIDQRLSLYRIVNGSDVVPTLPPSVCPNFNAPKNPFLYQQCGFPFTFTLNWKSIANNHELAVYIAGLDKIIEL